MQFLAFFTIRHNGLQQIYVQNLNKPTDNSNHIDGMLKNTLAPRSLSTARCDCGASHLFPANTLTTSGAAFYDESTQNNTPVVRVGFE